MNKYLIAFTSDSHHLMNEPYFYFEIYQVDANNIEDANRYLDYYQRQFSLKYKVPLASVNYLWTCGVK